MLGKGTNHFITGGMGEMLGFLDWRHFFYQISTKSFYFLAHQGN